MALNFVLKTTLKNLNSKKWLTISDTDTILVCKHMLLNNPPATQLRNTLTRSPYKRKETILIGAPTDSNERMCFFYNEGHKIMNNKPPSVAMNDPFEVPKRMKQFVIYDRLTALIPQHPR